MHIVVFCLYATQSVGLMDMTPLTLWQYLPRLIVEPMALSQFPEMFFEAPSLRSALRF
jgi:hypothetical protein